MAMTSSSRGLSSDINVTPLIDVLLVLLIIFMVIVPVTPKGLDSQVPQPARTQAPANPDTIVLEVMSQPGSGAIYRINQQEVSRDELFNKLQAIYSTRAEKVLFVQGTDDLDFDLVAQVIDIAHRAGVDQVGLVTPKVEAGA